MCFSAEADFVSGAVITGIGIATLAKVEKPRELALGVLPLAFGLHQLVEGFVWLGLHDKISQDATDVAIHLYLVFAWVVLPVLVPVGLLLITRDPRRRQAMALCVGIGSLVSVYLAWSLINNDITARVAGHTVQYGGAGGHALARHGALRRRDVRSPVDLVPASHRLVRGLQPRCCGRDRVRASRRPHLALVRLGGGGERPDLHAVHGVEADRSWRSRRSG